MKKIVIGLIILLFALNCYSLADKNKILNQSELQKIDEKLSSINSRIDSSKNVINQLKLDKEYIIENYKIQNQTILYISTLLGILLTIVIVYFGWRAQKVENEYERAKNDRVRINEQFDLFFKELNDKKNELNETLNQINQIKTNIESQKENIAKIIEDFILTFTKDYIESHKDELFKNKESEKKAEETVSPVQIAQIAEQIELLERLQHSSNPDFDYRKVDIYFNTKKYNKVIKIIEELLKEDDFKKSYYFNYAYALSEVNDKDNSLKYYNEYLKHNPNSPAALNNIGVIYQTQQILDKAIIYFEQALEKKTAYLYFTNLLNCYSEIGAKLEIIKKYTGKFEELDENSEEKKLFRLNYLKFIEDNLLINELFEYHREEYQKSDNVSTFLNLLEASILAREEYTYNELIEKSETYKFNSAYKLILNLLIALNHCIKSEDCKNELNNIEIISQDKSAFSSKWRFNLIDGILTRLPQSDAKSSIEKTIEILKTNK